MCKAAYDMYEGFCAETIQTMTRFDSQMTGSGNGIITVRRFRQSYMSFLVTNSQITFLIMPILAFPA